MIAVIVDRSQSRNDVVAVMLNTQLPTTSPTTISSRPSVAELIPATNSGSEVTDAMRRIPVRVLPMPVFSAMTP